LLPGLVGDTAADVAQELSHLDKVPTWFPVFPARFAKGKLGGVMEGKEEKSSPVFLQEAALRVERPFLSLLLNGSSLLGLIFGQHFFLLLGDILRRDGGLFFTLFKNGVLLFQ
jgi:hypothetical protein